MQTNTLKLVYVHTNLLHVSANHVAIFSEVQYRGMETTQSIE